jgi:hypothetical protein
MVAHGAPFTPACLSMLASVPGFRSLPRLPAIVTVPGLEG